MAFRTGDRVHQLSYGVGEIVEISREYVTIAFDDGATRKFVASLVRLEPSTVPRPPRPKRASRTRPRKGTSLEGRSAGAKGATS
jgi:hypothetical protein